MKLDLDIRLKRENFELDAKLDTAASALGIFGPSGCGKTTLFRCLAGLERPDAGHIRVNDETLFDAQQNIFAPAHKRSIGLLFQDARLFPHWSVDQNLRAGEFNKVRRSTRPFSYEDMVDLLELSSLIQRPVHDLSGGEKQRVALGRSLLAHPRLLLMDEPVTGLDAPLKAQILPFLSKIHRSFHIPTILVSHDLGEILQLTDQLVLMRNGRIVGTDRLATLVRNPETLQELKGSDLANVLRVRVTKHNPERGTTVLETGGHALSMGLTTTIQPGQEVCIGVTANQVAIALEKIHGVSMQNQLPGVVDELVHAGDRSLCCLTTPAGPLFAEITKGTEQDMKLRPGLAVHALFKSRTVQLLGGGNATTPAG